MHAESLSSLQGILLFVIGGIVFVGGGLVSWWILRPHRPDAEKNTSYESGEEPTGTAWARYDARFLRLALLFVLFEVEILVLFPIATAFGGAKEQAETNGAWGWFALLEAGVFIGLLIVGLAYAWAKGHLDWVRPKPVVTDYQSRIPRSAYAKWLKSEPKGEKN